MPLTFQPDLLHKKVALVTGGASGIGRVSALLLAKEGATVVVTDVQDDAGKDCVSSIKRGSPIAPSAIRALANRLIGSRR